MTQTYLEGQPDCLELRENQEAPEDRVVRGFPLVHLALVAQQDQQDHQARGVRAEEEEGAEVVQVCSTGRSCNNRVNIQASSMKGSLIRKEKRLS